MTDNKQGYYTFCPLQKTLRKSIILTEGKLFVSKRERSCNNLRGVVAVVRGWGRLGQATPRLERQDVPQNKKKTERLDKSS